MLRGAPRALECLSARSSRRALRRGPCAVSQPPTARARARQCPRCHILFALCPPCARARYCSTTCACAARRDGLRNAAQAYQRTGRGRRLHAVRQARYRERRARNVTHQSSTQPPPTATVGTHTDPATTPPCTEVLDATHSPDRGDRATRATPRTLPPLVPSGAPRQDRCHRCGAVISTRWHLGSPARHPRRPRPP